MRERRFIIQSVASTATAARAAEPTAVPAMIAIMLGGLEGSAGAWDVVLLTKELVFALAACC